MFLRKCLFRNRPYKYETASWLSLAFFESYFSNFIEGTEFLIDEAEDIIFTGKEIYNRHADSHDVLALHQIVGDITDLSRTPKSPDEFISQLKSRHATASAEAREESWPI